jgi:hypothetical protein
VSRSKRKATNEELLVSQSNLMFRQFSKRPLVQHRAQRGRKEQMCTRLVESGDGFVAFDFECSATHESVISECNRESAKLPDDDSRDFPWWLCDRDALKAAEFAENNGIPGELGRLCGSRLALSNSKAYKVRHQRFCHQGLVFSGC